MIPQAQIDPSTGDRFLPITLRGEELLKHPLLNKATAFTTEERDALELHGLLPDHVSNLDEQVERVRNQFDRKSTDMDKNIYLNGLMDRNETLFYKFILSNLEETVPIIYTPTVAYACRYWSQIFRRSRGIYVTPRDRGQIARALRCRPAGDRPVIVVTDNERILGIGDQGAGGMGIPIGKLALYAAAAGIHPSRLVAVSLDVGTSNPELLADPLYLGYRDARLRGSAYDELIEEFVAAVKEVFPGALLQWEDFANTTSFTNLERYRHEVLSFNDDIQGTAAMVVAGLIAASRHIGMALRDHRVVIVGAGSAGIGIRDLIRDAMAADGASESDLADRIFVLDSRGLLVDGRPDLTPAKRRLAVGTDAVAAWHIDDHPIGLDDVIRNARATVLIGVSGIPGIFTEEIVRRMTMSAARPIILPLSNPTSHAEVTPAGALRWSDGRAIVATGSPFPPVEFGDRVHDIGQANNVFVFPGMGLGALTVGASEVSEGMFLAGARALAGLVGDDHLKAGRLYPPMSSIRESAHVVATAVARAAIEEGFAEPMEDVASQISNAMWEPTYVPYRAV